MPPTTFGEEGLEGRLRLPGRARKYACFKAMPPKKWPGDTRVCGTKTAAPETRENKFVIVGGFRLIKPTTIVAIVGIPTSKAK